MNSHQGFEVLDPFLPPGAPLPAVRLACADDDGPSQQHGESRPHGSLVLVDLGAMAVNQVTIEGRRWVEQSERVYYLGADSIIEKWLHSLNKDVQRLGVEDDMTARALADVRAGLSVCLAHSGLQTEVMKAVMADRYARDFVISHVPGVSNLDCLIADLGLDPLRTGLSLCNIDQFVRRSVDLQAALILSLDGNRGALPLALIEHLAAQFGTSHEIILYGPARYAAFSPVIRKAFISRLATEDLAQISHLCVLPELPCHVGPDE
jgi:hypothetical protein